MYLNEKIHAESTINVINQVYQVIAHSRRNLSHHRYQNHILFSDVNSKDLKSSLHYKLIYKNTFILSY